MANRMLLSPRGRGVLLTLVLLAALVVVAGRRFSHWRRPAATPSAVQPQLTDIGPRLVSNQTSTPILAVGSNLRVGDRLLLQPNRLTLPTGAPGSSLPTNARWEVPLSAVAANGAWGWARLPALDLPSQLSEVDLTVGLLGQDHVDGSGGQARLTVVNDAHFVDLVGLASTSQASCAISKTTDALICRRAGESGAVVSLPMADGPSAIAATGAQLVVGHEYAAELRLIDPRTLATRSLPGPAGVTGLAWDEHRGVIYLAEHLHNTAQAIDSVDGRVLWSTPIDPGPGPLALMDSQLAVGSRQTGEVQLLATDGGRLLATVAPAPGMPIVGGHTAGYSADIMGGLAVRDLAYSKGLKLLLVASAGPNIGPNADRMEVSMNGGLTAIDPVRQQAIFHVGFGAGVTQALALDEVHQLVYASDLALGLVRVYDLRALARLKEAPSEGLPRATGLLATLAIPPPQDFPRVLPAETFSTKGRAGSEIHSGPVAMSLSTDGRQLMVLDRFSGTLAAFDTGLPNQRGRMRLREQTPLANVLTQPERRLGQVLYYADLGRTGMSCDACHVDGHVGGLLFSKSHPIRLYRSTSVRGSRETPPYFIPANQVSLASTAAFVGSRNRFQNPPMSSSEIRRLADFCSQIPTPPNPSLSEDGSPPANLRLPDGEWGRPTVGAELFGGKAACATCHPAPLFTTDQWPATRGRAVAVGTPAHFPLRPELQDPVSDRFPPPSLNGIWDLFPLTTTGSAGLTSRAGQLEVSSRFPLRELLSRRDAIPHGGAAGLTAAEQNDLLAFLLTL